MRPAQTLPAQIRPAQFRPSQLGPVRPLPQVQTLPVQTLPQVQTLPGRTLPELDEELQTGEPAVAHIVKTGHGETAAAKVLEARIYGTPIEALCGHVWVPSRDPKQLPLCEKCKGIYEMYRSFNDGLNDSPTE